MPPLDTRQRKKFQIRRHWLGSTRQVDNIFGRKRFPREEKMRIVDKKPFVGCSTRPLSSTWYNNNSNNIRPLLFSRDPAQSKVQLRQKRAPAAWMPSHNGNMTVAMDAARLVTNIRVISGSNQVQFIIGSLHFSAAYLVIYQSRTSSSSAQIFRRLLTAKWRHSLQQLFHFPSQHTRRLASVPRGIIGINLKSTGQRHWKFAQNIRENLISTTKNRLPCASFQQDAPMERGCSIKKSEKTQKI